MTEQIHPETFDIDAWLADANLPEDSADVYKAGHLAGELHALKRRILEGEAIPDPERTVADKSSEQRLLEQYAALLQEYADSKLTVYVRALSTEQLRKMRKAHERKTDSTVHPQKANEEFGFELLAEAIVAVRHNDGERKSVKFTPAQVQKLVAAIGEPQTKLITEARMRAQNAVPEVDADFLQQRSGASQEPGA
jgi:hypothetical protein